MAKKKQRLPMIEANAKKFVRMIKRQVGLPESLLDWEADMTSAYIQGWMDGLKHAQRIRTRRLKRSH